MRPGRHPYLANVLLIVGGTAFSVVLAEAAFRVLAASEDGGWLSPHLQLPRDPLPEHPAALASIIRRSADPLLLYELRPNLRVLFETARVTTNEAGVRNPSHAIGPHPGALRIVGIGDSFMFGFGVGDRDTYLAVLEKDLDGRPCPVETVNLGVPGYNGVMEVRSLDLKGLQYRPDVVLIEFISNDLDLPNFVWRPRDVWSLRRSFLAEFVRNRLPVFRRRGLRDPVSLEPAAKDPSSDGRRFGHDLSRVPPEDAALVGWASYERAVRHLAQLSRERGFKVVLMGWDVAPEEARVRALAAELGFHVLNLGPRVERWAARHRYPTYLESPLVRGSVDPHPSALGHEQVAAWLESFLEQEGLLPTAGSCPK